MVIGSDGEQLGVMSRNEALQLAYDNDYDLLCVAPNAQPPVCKYWIMVNIVLKLRKKAKKQKETAEY